jgi:hypothetical protein
VTTGTTIESSGWIAVRCIFRSTAADGAQVYEERVTIWQETDVDRAIEAAEREADTYAPDTDSEFVGLSQAYVLADQPRHGAEIFSLMRDSDLDPDAYVDHYFDTGTERQGTARR